MKKKSKKIMKHHEYLSRWLKFGVYGPRCKVCNKRLILFFKYDAECCPNCNVWIDAKCGDPNCTYCSTRPDKPIAALAIEEILEGNRILEDKDYSIKLYEKRLKGQNRQKKRASRSYLIIQK